MGFTKQTYFETLNKKAVIITIIICIAYGCLVEILQSTVFIHRSGDIRDALANAVGVMIGYWIFRRKFSRSKKPVV